MGKHDFSQCFFGDERVCAVVALIETLWASGLPDSITRVLVGDWNRAHCFPPVNMESLQHVPLVRDTLFSETGDT